MITQNFVSAETQLEWEKVFQTCTNPLGLNETTVQESLEAYPAREYQGAVHLGRYLIPYIFVRYNQEDQPRDKSNDADHVNNLVNNFETVGYRLDTAPPIVCFDDQDSSFTKLKALSGFNRKESLTRLGQQVYIFDVYKFESRFWEVVARNESNHHSNPQLSQTKEDYIKEVCNSVLEGIVESDSDSISDFVDLIATDKTAKVRKAIKITCYNNCQIFPNFRTYNSVGSGSNTLNGFIRENNYAKQGVEGRTDEELKTQGYITYCAANGDNKSTWMRALYHGVRLGLPVWVFGYAPNRVNDLLGFRKGYVEDFNELKEVMINFASLVTDGEESSIDEDVFPVKLAGFLPQYVKPNPKDMGRATENSLVDVYGEAVRFDPDGDCLTLTQS